MSKKHKKKSKEATTPPLGESGTVVTTLDEKSGAMVNSVTFAPNGVDHRLQREITDHLHQIVEADGRMTLAELGYLHINTLTYNPTSGELNLRIYFDARFASREIKSPVNGNTETVPLNELNVFKNRLFVGRLEDAVDYWTIMAPKTKAIEDEKGRASIRIKDDSKLVETKALVLDCNLATTVASMLDIDLFDPYFKITVNTKGKGARKALQSVVANVTADVPAALTVVYQTSDNGYNPDDAENYLRMLAERVSDAQSNRSELESRVRKDAKKRKKDDDRRSGNSGSYGKYA